MTHASRPSLAATTAGVVHVIWVAVSDATAHGCPPTVTPADEALEWPRYSKPAPFTVSSVPPPAEPEAGLTAVIATTYVKLTPVATWASPRVGSKTATAAAPGAPLVATQLTLVVPSAVSSVETEVHA